VSARKLGYLITEGPHDIAFLGGVLKPCGFKLQRTPAEVDPFWAKLIPTSFPHGNDLLKRMPVPQFFQSDSHSLAIHQAEGDSQLVSRLQLSLAALDDWERKLVGIGLLLDSDDQLPAKRLAGLHDKWAQGAEPQPLVFPPQPGLVQEGPPCTGVYILPDNQSQGTLEDLLLEAGAHVYPHLLAQAQAYVKCVKDSADLKTKRDKEEIGAPSGPKKAIVAAIASILKPGKAIQMSIQDNHWLREDAVLQLPRLLSIKDFLAKLFAL